MGLIQDLEQILLYQLLYVMQFLLYEELFLVYLLFYFVFYPSEEVK